MPYRSTLRSHSFENKLVVVTGGGSGIGRCISHELCSLGATVVLIGRDQQKLDSVSAEITEDGGHCDSYSLDIRDEDNVVKTVAAIVKKYDNIDGLVNNAGGQFPAPLETISQNGFESVVSANLIGGFLMAREVYKQSMVKHGGAIVNISADCRSGMPGMGHSGAARAGMENLTQTAAWEWGRSGVRVNTVAPGWVASSGIDTYPDYIHDLIRNLHKSVPLSRLANEAEISAAVCFLLSDGAAYINGATLRVDGGASIASAPAVYELPQGTPENGQVHDGFHRAVRPKVLQ
jgi:citronellol/citronellal dehydrogenase